MIRDLHALIGDAAVVCLTVLAWAVWMVLR